MIEELGADDRSVLRKDSQTPSKRRFVGTVLPLLAICAVLTATHPFADTPLPAQPAFVVILLALVGCFDVLSVILLLGQFWAGGQPRILVLCLAFTASFVTMLGWAGAFPGVVGTPGPLGAVPSTAPWLWVAWHAVFPVLLALALAPWPRSLARTVPAHRRIPLACATLGGTAALAALLVATVVALAEELPVVIQGTDTTAMTRIAGPVMLPVVVVAVVITIVGAYRRGGPEGWAGLAAAATLGDVVLTLFSYHRYSAGWYAGRTLTIVSAAVVLVALLGELGGVKRRLVIEGERLRAQFEHTDRLERMQHTLLAHMSDGVVMQDRAGMIVASNHAAQQLLGISSDELIGTTPLDPRPRLVGPDGKPWGSRETPTRMTLRTGVPQHQQILGVCGSEGIARWLSVGTAAVKQSEGGIEYVVSTLSDVTERHAAVLARETDAEARRARIQHVLGRGGPDMVFQPIVELSTGRAIGAEALARFEAYGDLSPDRWFADAAEIGLGVELELSAIRAGLRELDRLPDGAYLSLNAGPDTVASPELYDMLRASQPERVVLELTEHVGISDYAALTDALHAVRRLGVRLAVDDTGAGFASLQHIINLRPDVIKLDRALVTGIDHDPARRALAGALLTFAKELGAKVVAEGIENAREHTVLRRLGVRYGQGFHLGRPGALPLVDHRQASASA